MAVLENESPVLPFWEGTGSPTFHLGSIQRGGIDIERQIFNGKTRFRFDHDVTYEQGQPETRNTDYDVCHRRLKAS